jgi:hypothetical protein
MSYPSGVVPLPIAQREMPMGAARGVPDRIMRWPGEAMRGPYA